MNRRELEQALGADLLELYSMSSENGRERLRAQLSEDERELLASWESGETPEPEQVPDVGEFIRTREARVSGRHMDVVIMDEVEVKEPVPLPPHGTELGLPWYGWLGLLVLIVVLLRVSSGL